MYRLLFYESKALHRDNKKLYHDKKTAGFVKDAIGLLSVNPFAPNLDIKKLKGSPQEGAFRLRCWKWRVLFDVDVKNRIVIVYRIMQRKEGY